jgi:hypothetical protein
MRARAEGCAQPSKQAVNPGDFGPYKSTEAATLFLMRQYTLDHGADGIVRRRADRIAWLADRRDDRPAFRRAGSAKPTSERQRWAE